MGDEVDYIPSWKQEKKKDIPDVDYKVQSAQLYWDVKVKESPLQRLRYLDARLAQGATIDTLRVAELVREAGAKAVLSDPDAIGLIRQLFGEKGVQRLKDRASTAQHQTREPNMVADMAHPLHQRGTP